MSHAHPRPGIPRRRYPAALRLLRYGPATRRLFWALGLLLLTLAMGVIGYRVIEGFSAFDALYQTVLTVTTIGFQEVEPLNRDGRIFTIFLAIFGVGSALYLLSAVASILLEGDLRRDVEAWRMENRIERMSGHVIIAGAGRVGRGVADALAERDHDFVLIDSQQEAADALGAHGYAVMHADASNNDALEQVGLERARALVVATGSDATNTFIVLTAKGIRPSLYVVARAVETESQPKLRQAGADRVISPTAIAGRRLAISALSPALGDFAETVLRGGEATEVLAQIDVQTGSSVVGSSIADAFHGFDEVSVLGVRHANGRLAIAPARTLPLADGDAVLVIGETHAVDALSERWAPTESPAPRS